MPYFFYATYETNGDSEYERNGAGEYVPTGDAAMATAMLRVMVLHDGPPESLTASWAPPLQRIVQDGARLWARLPAYLAQRWALLDTHCAALSSVAASPGLGARLQGAHYH